MDGMRGICDGVMVSKGVYYVTTGYGTIYDDIGDTWVNVQDYKHRIFLGMLYTVDAGNTWLVGIA